MFTADEDGSGGITKDEFFHFFSHKDIGPRALIDVYDAHDNHDGEIHHQDATNFILAADTDKNGKVTL